MYKISKSVTNLCSVQKSQDLRVRCPTVAEISMNEEVYIILCLSGTLIYLCEKNNTRHIHVFSFFKIISKTYHCKIARTFAAE